MRNFWRRLSSEQEIRSVFTLRIMLTAMLAAAAAVVVPAYAHHSYANYLEHETVTMEGTVETIRFANTIQPFLLNEKKLANDISGSLFVRRQVHFGRFELHPHPRTHDLDEQPTQHAIGIRAMSEHLSRLCLGDRTPGGR